MNVQLIHCGRLIFEDYTENYADWTENEAVMILDEASKFLCDKIPPLIKKDNSG